MSTYKEQDAENLLAHLREGIDPDSVSALLDDTRVDCEGTGEGESVWMHLVLPGARYGKDDRVIYDPYETFSGRSLKSSGGLPMVEFYLHRGDDRPDAARNIKDMEPLPYLIGRYYMKTLLADHQGFGILLQDTPHLGLPADTVLDVQDALAETARACAAGCDFEIDAADADIARCIAGGGYRGGAKVAAVYVPVGDLPRETTVFADMDRALASTAPKPRPWPSTTASPYRCSVPPAGRTAGSSRTAPFAATARPRSSAAASSSSRRAGTAGSSTCPGGRSRAPRSASPIPRRAPSGQPPSSRGRCAAPSASRSSGRGGRPPTSPRWCRSSPRSREETAGRTGSTSEKNRARRGGDV